MGMGMGQASAWGWPDEAPGVPAESGCSDALLQHKFPYLAWPEMKCSWSFKCDSFISTKYVFRQRADARKDSCTLFCMAVNILLSTFSWLNWLIFQTWDMQNSTLGIFCFEWFLQLKGTHKNIVAEKHVELNSWKNLIWAQVLFYALLYLVHHYIVVRLRHSWFCYSRTLCIQDS